MLKTARPFSFVKSKIWEFFKKPTLKYTRTESILSNAICVKVEAAPKCVTYFFFKASAYPFLALLDGAKGVMPLDK